MSCCEILHACFRSGDCRGHRAVFAEEMVTFLVSRVKGYADKEFREIENPDVEASKIELEEYIENKLTGTVRQTTEQHRNQTYANKITLEDQIQKILSQNGAEKQVTDKNPRLNVPKFYIRDHSSEIYPVAGSDEKARKRKPLIGRIDKVRCEKQRATRKGTVGKKFSFVQKIFKKKRARSTKDS